MIRLVRSPFLPSRGEVIGAGKKERFGLDPDIPIGGFKVLNVKRSIIGCLARVTNSVV